MQGHASDGKKRLSIMQELIIMTYCLGVHAPVYDLYAVSNHSGTPQFGHYTADALNSETNRWHHFNDTMSVLYWYYKFGLSPFFLNSVSAVDEIDVFTECGYVLFYVKRENQNI